jgi:hypothetical protein
MDCATGCATEFALCATSTRYEDFPAKAKPDDLAGFSGG